MAWAPHSSLWQVVCAGDEMYLFTNMLIVVIGV